MRFMRSPHAHDQFCHAQDGRDLIYCSHVLKHVPDDRKALREFVSSRSAAIAVLSACVEHRDDGTPTNRARPRPA